MGGATVLGVRLVRAPLLDDLSPAETGGSPAEGHGGRASWCAGLRPELTRRLLPGLGAFAIPPVDAGSRPCARRAQPGDYDDPDVDEGGWDEDDEEDDEDWGDDEEEGEEETWQVAAGG